MSVVQYLQVVVDTMVHHLLELCVWCIGQRITALNSLAFLWTSLPINTLPASSCNYCYTALSLFRKYEYVVLIPSYRKIGSKSMFLHCCILVNGVVVLNQSPSGRKLRMVISIISFSDAVIFTNWHAHLKVAVIRIWDATLILNVCKFCS
jgi:hypothetical protein